MFESYIDILKNWYDTWNNEELYFDLVREFLDLAHDCGECPGDFINNSAMHPEKWKHTGRQARLNALLHYRKVRNAYQ